MRRVPTRYSIEALSDTVNGEQSFGISLGEGVCEFNSTMASFLEKGVAMRYGDIRASLERCGSPSGPLDTLIGSHAHVADVILVTRHTREFSRIEGLRLEEWTIS